MTENDLRLWRKRDLLNHAIDVVTRDRLEDYDMRQAQRGPVTAYAQQAAPRVPTVGTKPRLKYKRGWVYPADQRKYAALGDPVGIEYRRVIESGSVHKAVFLVGERYYNNAMSLAGQVGEDHPTIVHMKALASAYYDWSMELATSNPPV